MSKKTPKQRKRVTLKPKCPNPLFEKWLHEWKDEAASKDSAMQYCFGKALTSLKKYPLCLKSGKECAILRNFGTRLCVMLDRKLAEFRKDHPDVLLEDLSTLMPHTKFGNSSKEKKKLDCNSSKSPDTNRASKAKGSKKQHSYVPAWRSGPYALILALLAASKKTAYPGYMLKEELMISAQHLCDTSFKKPDPGSHYTAWSSMGGLVKKGLVTRSGCPVKFALTPEGEELARRLYAAHEEDTQLTEMGGSKNSGGSVLPVATFPLSDPSMAVPKSVGPSVDIRNAPGPSNTNHKALPCKKHQKEISEVQPQDTILTPGSFEVLLLVDKAETLGDADTVSELKATGVKFELRHLKVGDYTWICRDYASGFEMVLPYIVERKRIDDLAKSIVDGRYHEQKFRLKRCGLANRIYLVEGHGKSPHTLLPLSTLIQAAVNTQVVDNFTVKHTANHRESMAYLAMFTDILSQLFLNKTIVSCSKSNLPPCDISDDLVSLMTFEEFNKSAAKKRKFQVREMFIRHLIKLRGLSVEKAMAIVQRYPTPSTLLAAYKEDNGEKLLSDIPHGNLSRLLGPTLSKTIFLLYTGNTLR